MGEFWQLRQVPTVATGGTGAPEPLIPLTDLKITGDQHPPGGQHCGVLSGVTVTHLPTGISVYCSTERSQHRNRMIAIDGLLGALTSPHFRG